MIAINIYYLLGVLVAALECAARYWIKENQVKIPFAIRLNCFRLRKMDAVRRNRFVKVSKKFAEMKLTIWQ